MSAHRYKLKLAVADRKLVDTKPAMVAVVITYRASVICNVPFASEVKGTVVTGTVGDLTCGQYVSVVSKISARVIGYGSLNVVRAVYPRAGGVHKMVSAVELHYVWSFNVALGRWRTRLNW